MSRDASDTPDLDALAAWCRGAPKGEIGPNDLMRHPWHLTRNAACSALEALEARGDFERIPGSTLAWKLAPAPPQPARGYSLPLSPAEHGALLRALEERRHTYELLALYETVLREMRTYAAALPQHEITQWVQRLDSERDAYAAEVGRSPEVPSPDAVTLRSLRSRLLRKEKP